MSAINDNDCSTCYEVLRSEVKVLECGHRFHQSCFDAWDVSPFNLNRSCSYCRQPYGGATLPQHEPRPGEYRYYINDWDTFLNFLGYVIWQTREREEQVYPSGGKFYFARCDDDYREAPYQRFVQTIVDNLQVLRKDDLRRIFRPGWVTLPLRRNFPTSRQLSRRFPLYKVTYTGTLIHVTYGGAILDQRLSQRETIGLEGPGGVVRYLSPDEINVYNDMWGDEAQQVFENSLESVLQIRRAPNDILIRLEMYS